MAASYPAAAKSFTAINAGDTVTDTMWEDAYDEITALEQALISGLAHDLTPDATAGTRSLGTNAKQWKLVAVASGTVSAPSVAVGDADVGLYSSGANALDVTTNGVKALGIDSTQFIDSPTQPRCVAYHNTTQTIAAAVATSLNLNSEVVDVGAMHDTVTNNSRITVPAGGDGFYVVMGLVTTDGAVASANIRIAINGANAMSMFTATGVQPPIVLNWVGNLAAGDYVEIIVTQNAATSTVYGSATGDAANRLSVVKLW